MFLRRLSVLTPQKYAVVCLQTHDVSVQGVLPGRIPQAIPRNYERVMESRRNPRSGIKRVSTSRAKAQGVYQSRKRLFLKKHPFCGCCQKRKTKDIHHAFGRTGKLLLWSAFWVPVCRNCHDTIGRNPKLGREMFWIPKGASIPILCLAPKGYWLRPWEWVQRWMIYWNPSHTDIYEQCERCGWMKYGECTRCEFV